MPVIAFSVGEEELRGVDTKPLVGHLAAWNYFKSVDTPENKAFIAKWRDLHQEPEARDQRPDGSGLHRLPHVGAGGAEGRHAPMSTRCAKR